MTCNNSILLNLNTQSLLISPFTKRKVVYYIANLTVLEPQNYIRFETQVKRLHSESSKDNKESNEGSQL